MYLSGKLFKLFEISIINLLLVLLLFLASGKVENGSNDEKREEQGLDSQNNVKEEALSDFIQT